MANKKLRRQVERRLAPIDADSVEVREDSDGLRFRGHAAVFNQETDFGVFREVVAPGAFARTIENKSDVRFLFNHDPNTVMARTTTGTLVLEEDKDGLFTEAHLGDDDVDVQRLIPKLKSGNVSQMSFGFSVVENGETREQGEDDESPLRTLREVDLFDVSPVTFPAYEGTDAGLRAAIEDVRTRVQTLGLPVAFWGPQTRDMDALLDELVAIDEPQADPERIRAAIDALSVLLQDSETDDSALEGHSQELHSLPLDAIQRVLELNRNRTNAAA